MLQASFLRNGTPLSLVTPTLENEPCSRMPSFIIATAISFHRDAEVRRVIEHLREDVASSAAERVRLALEESKGGKRLSLPCRAWFCLADFGFPLWCGDYCMPDEKINAARIRVGKILGISDSVLEDAIDCLDERSQLQHHYVDGFAHAMTTSLSRSMRPKDAQKLACIVGVAIVAFVAMIFPAILRCQVGIFF